MTQNQQGRFEVGAVASGDRNCRVEKANQRRMISSLGAGRNTLKYLRGVGLFYRG